MVTSKGMPLPVAGQDDHHTAAPAADQLLLLQVLLDLPLLEPLLPLLLPDPLWPGFPLILRPTVVVATPRVAGIMPATGPPLRHVSFVGNVALDT